MKLIIDTDPGIDDAMAIAYAAASDRFDLIALTTVFGNVEVDQATNNALWLSEQFAETFPVYEGAAVPVEMEPLPVSTHVHGEYGFGRRRETPEHAQKQQRSAAVFLAEEAARAPGTLTVCAIGPLTNIALAIERDPAFLSNLKQLVVMGGSLRAGGNVTAHAEANFWHDPHAAHQVLTAEGASKVTVVGLDVTRDIPFLPAHYNALEAASPQMGGFLNDIGQFYMAFYETVTGTYQAYVHDAAAVIASERPDLFETERHALAVICEGEALGAMVASDHSAEACTVCTKVSADAVNALYLETMKRLP